MPLTRPLAPLLTALAATAVVSSCADGDPSEPDATSDSAAEDAPGDGSVDDGTLADAAPAPLACAARTTGAWLVTRFDFVEAGEGGVVAGFDLDGLVSGPGDAAGCSKPDATGPDGTTGVDNQLASFLPLLAALGVSLEDLIAARVREGTLLMVMQMDGEFGACEGLRFRRGEGVLLTDADGEPSSHQTLSLQPGSTVSTASTCTFNEDCAGDASGDSLVLEFAFLDREIRIDLQSWRGTFVGEDDGTLTGLIGGVVPLADVMGIVTSLGGCGDERIRQALEPIVPGLADIFPNEAGECQGISAALRVEAVPVFLFED
ncbi:MAG: hypothetical protein H6697_10940 [Myxococcales bacterium]|nr:hypothetical protein [Myxococcales bacterium]